MFAREYAMVPDVSADMSLRDVAVMIWAAQDRRRERLWHTSAMLDGQLNYGGMRGRDFEPVNIGGHHFEGFTDGGGPAAAGEITEERRDRLRRLTAEHQVLRAQHGEA